MGQGSITTDGSKEIRMFFQSLNLVTSGVGTLADVLYKTMMLHKEDPVNKAIADTLKHNDAVIFEVENFEEADSLRKKMSENDLKFTATAAYKDKVYVVVPKSDLEKASEIVNAFYDERTSGLFTAEFIDQYSDRKVQEVKGLSEEETSLFILRCKEQHIPINVAGPSDGVYRIRFAERDMDKMDRVRIDVAATLSGQAKDLYKDQLKWRNEYEKSIKNTIITGKYPDGSTVAEGSAIVGTDGKRVEITKMHIKLYDAGTCKSFSRNASEADLKKSTEEISRFVKGIEKPVFLDRKEYNALKAMNTNEREAFFADKERAGFLLPRSIYKETLAKCAERDRSPDGRKYHVGDMIVDSKGNSIEVHEKEFVITSKEKGTQTIDRKAEATGEFMKETIQNMHNPVFLDAARAKEYKEMAPETKEDYITQKEVADRTFVEGRHVITREEMETLARAEAMRHTIDVRLQHDGIELPKTEKMTYHDASLVFGLTSAEAEGFNTFMQHDVVSAHDEDDISDVVEQVEAHFGKTDPHETVIPISKELVAESILDEQVVDTAFDHNFDHSFDTVFDMDEFNGRDD